MIDPQVFASSLFTGFLSGLWFGVRVFWPYILVFIFGLFLKYFVYPKLKGKAGEWFVMRKLKQLDSEQYKVLHNVLLRSSGKTSTTQIDHIVVSQYGIFCIETKNYAGWIFGNAQDEYWTQVIYRHKNQIYNPLRQNFGHAKSIHEALGNVPESCIIPLVVFPSAEKLKITETNAVIFLHELIKTIKQYRQQQISITERDILYEKLVQANITDTEQRKQHVRQVRKLR